LHQSVVPVSFTRFPSEASNMLPVRSTGDAARTGEVSVTRIVSIESTPAARALRRPEGLKDFTFGLPSYRMPSPSQGKL
jgi:hypothetical protein